MWGPISPRSVPRGWKRTTSTPPGSHSCETETETTTTTERATDRATATGGRAAAWTRLTSSPPPPRTPPPPATGRRPARGRSRSTTVAARRYGAPPRAPPSTPCSDLRPASSPRATPPPERSTWGCTPSGRTSSCSTPSRPATRGRSSASSPSRTRRRRWGLRGDSAFSFVQYIEDAAGDDAYGRRAKRSWGLGERLKFDGRAPKLWSVIRYPIRMQRENPPAE